MKSLTITEFQNDLNKTLSYLQQQLTRATVDSKHELRQVYLATTGDAFPEVRTVILRSVNWKENAVVFHTDFRSKKYSELLAKPQASLLGYSRQKNYQIRLRGRVILNHKNEASKKCWQRLSISSRRSYLVHSPGSALSDAGDGLSSLYKAADLQLPSTEIGFDHFVSATFVIFEIEWLLLDREGHRRAIFKFNEGEATPKDQIWICP